MNPPAINNVAVPLKSPTFVFWGIWVCFFLMFLAGIVALVGAFFMFFDVVTHLPAEDPFAQAMSSGSTANPDDIIAAWKAAFSDAQSQAAYRDAFTHIRPIGIALLALGALGTLIAFFAKWVCLLAFVHRIWSLLPAEHRRTSPNKAAWFLLIPLFNMYWVHVAYYGFARDANKVLGMGQGTEALSAGAFFWLAPCLFLGMLPYVGSLASLVFFVLWILFMVQAYQASKRLAHSSQP